MATKSTPSTITAITTQVAPVAPVIESTGAWRHPRFDEINKRLAASTFGEKNVKQILWRLTSFIALFLSRQLNNSIRWLFNVDVFKSIHVYLPLPLRLFLNTLLPLLLLAYSLIPLRPLFTTTDDLSDIALTPQQRQLFGLNPTSTPPTPGSQYSTPPRYSRSATPRSGSSSASGSPFSSKGSPLGSGVGQSAYSPNNSPLFQKAMGRDGNRRLSYGSPPALGIGRPAMDSNSSLASQITNSPSAGKGAGVGLNSRWLYERGRRSSSGFRSVYS